MFRGEEPLGGDSPRDARRGSGCGPESEARSGLGRKWIDAAGGSSLAWLLEKKTAGFVFVALLVTLVLPSEGFGVSLCGLYQSVGLPCPACGMTRSVSCFLHGEWGLSWGFHPLGWVAALLGLLVTSSLVWPGRWKEAAVRWMDRRRFAVWTGFWTILGVWVVYGAVRIALIVSGVWDFPPE